ncbi:aldo/keto reductase [Sorangium cellulosum]|uniref:Aldo/keto reductase n=1 Tax=Sorangium cellulosum TaxID=56 RepID=A0A2L0F808_SORCE|nr:aldo/keto reductase [Sorangium cellulosum]AUX47700.1 aldo/keto reductase [Sorangium cellulosum]
MTKRPSRRTILHTIGAGLALGACARSAQVGQSASLPGGGAQEPPKGAPPEAPGQDDIVLPPGGVMPTRPLGRTGVNVSLVGLGGFHMAVPKDEQESTRIVRFAIDHGITFLDNCWDYNDGESEVRMGNALQEGYRQKAFLMTKLDGRTRAVAEAQLEQSLRRLRTDVIDLVQMHEIIRMNEPAQIFGPGGAMEALVAAKKAGKIRFIGFTGHKDPDIHLATLKMAEQQGFTFDAVQMPLNVMDPHYRSFEKLVLPELTRQGIGVLGMKPFGGGEIIKTGAVTPMDCLHYPMSLQTSVVITGCDSMGTLKQALKAAYTFQPLGNERVSAILARTAELGAKGKYEQFKTTERFDGTTKNPHWLTTAKV